MAIRRHRNYLRRSRRNRLSSKLLHISVDISYASSAISRYRRRRRPLAATTRPETGESIYHDIIMVYFFRRSEFPPRGCRGEEERLKSISGQIVIFSVALAAAVDPVGRWSREKKRKGKKPGGKEAKNPSAEDFQLRRLKSSRGPLTTAAAAALLSSFATITAPPSHRHHPLKTRHRHAAPATVAAGTHAVARTKRGNSTGIKKKRERNEKTREKIAHNAFYDPKPFGPGGRCPRGGGSGDGSSNGNDVDGGGGGRRFIDMCPADGWMDFTHRRRRRRGPGATRN